MTNVRKKVELLISPLNSKLDLLLVYFALFGHDDDELGLVVEAHKRNGTHHYSNSVKSPLNAIFDAQNPTFHAFELTLD
jgi:hypothetical protein